MAAQMSWPFRLVLLAFPTLSVGKGSIGRIIKFSRKNMFFGIIYIFIYKGMIGSFNEVFVGRIIQCAQEILHVASKP